MARPHSIPEALSPPLDINIYARAAATGDKFPPKKEKNSPKIPRFSPSTSVFSRGFGPQKFTPTAANEGATCAASHTRTFHTQRKAPHSREPPEN